MGVGHWIPSKDGDPIGLGLYKRHYSAKKNAGSRTGLRQFVPPGQKMVLIERTGRGVFAWVRNIVERYDHQSGVCCTIFRNESETRSSDLIREAEWFAWRRWPGERLFTYVDPREVRSVNPGYCFKRAGWRREGVSKGGLILLAKEPA